MFDVLSQTYLPVEYKEDPHQWYFIRQDSRSRRWNAINPVPQSYNLGRQSIHTSHTTAAEVAPEDITFRTYGEPDQDSQCTVEQIKTSNILSSTITDNLHHSAMSQTMSALTLARMATTRSQDQFMGFSMKGKGPAFPPYIPGSGGGPSGGGSGGPPGRGPPGGGFFPAIAPGAAGGGGGKLGGNPPQDF